MNGNVFIIPVDDAAIFACGFVTALVLLSLMRGLMGTMVGVWSPISGVATEHALGAGAVC